MGKNLNIHFTKEDIQKKMCIQLYQSSRKCKLLEADLFLHGLHSLLHVTSCPRYLCLDSKSEDCNKQEREAASSLEFRSRTDTVSLQPHSISESSLRNQLGFMGKGNKLHLSMLEVTENLYSIHNPSYLPTFQNCMLGQNQFCHQSSFQILSLL